MSSNAPENSQFNPLDLSACACANLRRATRVVTQVYDNALAPLGIRATQFTLLATLTKLGEVPLTRLAEALVMDRTTLTRNLKPLVAKGLIGIEKDQDQRVRMIHLTDEGMKLFGQAFSLWQEVQARLVEAMGGARWAGILDDLAATAGAARGT